MIPGISLLFLLLITNCVTEFIPVVEEEEQLVVVEGLITDQSAPDTIRLSKSLPLGKKSEARPLGGCLVSITDDLDNVHILTEEGTGKYVTDPALFKGEAGRSYRLHITTSSENGSRNYESASMEMKPVPPIDSVYYEKTVIKPDFEGHFGIDGCQIFLDSHDPANECKYYRWQYVETWVLRLLFSVQNQTCYLSGKSNEINIKSTAAFDQSLVKRQPVIFISNETDRLRTRYSIEVIQYSMSEDEYNFWERLQNLTVEVGGLYDIIPSTIPGNMRCIDIPGEKVLGYFSVSAKATKRIYIDEEFRGIIDSYADCITDTVYGEGDIPGMDSTVWVLFDFPKERDPRMRVLTNTHGCADCTLRGTTEKPAYWTDQ